MGVILDDGAQQVFTSEDGRFYFEGVPLGTHALTLDRTSLPTNLETVGHDVKTFTLTEESLEVSGLIFLCSPPIDGTFSKITRERLTRKRQWFSEQPLPFFFGLVLSASNPTKRH